MDFLWRLAALFITALAKIQKWKTAPAAYVKKR